MQSTLQKQLKALNHQVDCKCGCFKEVIQPLQDFLKQELPLQQKILALYIKGKYYSYVFKQSKNLADIEEANTCFDEIFIICSSRREEVRNPKMWFRRIRAKLELVKQLSGEDREQVSTTCLEIIKKAQFKFLINSSFIWVEEEWNKLQ